MKVLIIRNFPSYMSVKKNTYNIQEVGLAKALIRMGHQCDIVFWTDKEEEIIEIPVADKKQVTIFYRKGKTALKNTIFMGCDELFNNYDILQPCEYNQIQSWMLAKKYPKKTVIYHGPYYSPYNKNYNFMCKFFDVFFLRRYIWMGTKFIVKSSMAFDFLRQKGINQPNIQVAGVGIDTQMLTSNDSDCNEPLYLKMMEDPDELKLLYIGRLEPRRNIMFIFDVFKHVHEHFPKSKLYVIGTGKKEYVFNSFSYAKKRGIFDSIVWQECMEQKFLSKIYKLSDFFLLPTEYEIFGMVLLEAMYYGNIALTTKNGGSSTLIDDKCGVVIPQLDTDLWSNTIIDIYTNPYRMKKMSEYANRRVCENYTWDHLVYKFLAQYKTLQD